MLHSGKKMQPAQMLLNAAVQGHSLPRKSRNKPENARDRISRWCMQYRETKQDRDRPPKRKWYHLMRFEDGCQVRYRERRRVSKRVSRGRRLGCLP
jgi:hypothetical protein